LILWILALADTKMMIGSLRSMYQNIQTPFGEIPIKGDEIRSEGETLKDKVLDKLKENTLPPIVIDIS